MIERWRNVEAIALRHSGKWLLGVLVQETSKKRRLKLFKGVITPKGNLNVMHKGVVYKISLVQRLNIPNLDYWFRMNSMVTPLMQKYFAKKGQKILPSYTDKEG